jgi:hypothetical protein
VYLTIDVTPELRISRRETIDLHVRNVSCPNIYSRTRNKGYYDVSTTYLGIYQPFNLLRLQSCHRPAPYDHVDLRTQSWWRTPIKVERSKTVATCSQPPGHNSGDALLFCHSPKRTGMTWWETVENSISPRRICSGEESTTAEDFHAQYMRICSCDDVPV